MITPLSLVEDNAASWRLLVFNFGGYRIEMNGESMRKKKKEAAATSIGGRS
jgi:hypothetical protein